MAALALDDSGGSNRKGSVSGSSRPTSARGKTTKEVELENALKMVRGRVTERDKKIKLLEVEKKELQRAIDQLESYKKKVQAKVDKETKMRTGAVTEKQQMKEILQKTQRAIAARMKLLGIDFSKCENIKDALDAALSAINKLISQLEEKEQLLKKMEEENAFLKNKCAEYESRIEKMKAKLNGQSETIDSQTKTIAEQGAKINELEAENAKYKEENEKLKTELNDLKQSSKSNKDDYSKKFDEMAAKILQLQSENVSKSETIKDLNKLIEELKATVKQQKETIDNQNSELTNLRKELNDKNAQISSMEAEIAALKARVKELEDELNAIKNKPTAEKSVQTEISGDIGTQLSDYPRLLKEIVDLKNLLGQKNDFIGKLEEENRELLGEMDDLLKKVVRFYPCSTNHKLPVLSMECSPTRYVMATGSSDMSVRLWCIDPDAKKASEKIRVYQRAIVDGKVDCLAWNFDGSLLACGTGYKDSPDGYVVVWSMRGDTKYSSLYAIRSRPTVRFGRVKSISFSMKNNQFLYCGDTTGSIWVFDLMKELEKGGSGLIAVVQTQRDVVNDLKVSMDGKYLFSVSLDQTLAVFELPGELGGDAKEDDSNGDKKVVKKRSSSKANISTPTGTSSSKAISLATQTSSNVRRKSGNSKRNLQLSNSSSNNSHGRSRSKSKKSETIKYSLAELLADESIPSIKHHKGVVIANDGKYPFWKVCISPTGQTVACASRKVRIFSIKGNPCDDPKGNVEKGPNVGDADLDHVRSLKYRKGNLLLCRTLVPRAKIFDAKTGKEIKKFSTKDPVQAVEFLPDDAFVCILTQVYSETSCDPPKLKLVKYSDNRVEVEKETDATWVGSGNNEDNENDDEKGDE